MTQISLDFLAANISPKLLRANHGTTIIENKKKVEQFPTHDNDKVSKYFSRYPSRNLSGLTTRKTEEKISHKIVQ